MARTLVRLLGGDTKATMALSELRLMTRDDSDVRLLADMLARAHSIVRALGLDPAHSTTEEVYRALINAAPQIEALACFKDSDWVIADFDGQIISFHPVDIVENYHHQLPLGEQRAGAGRVALGQEIYRRYREHPQTHNPSVSRVICDGGICRLLDKEA